MNRRMPDKPENWQLTGRGKDNPTADILKSLPKEGWGYVIWSPKPPFAFGQVAAAICTADRDEKQSLELALKMTAAPELYAALVEQLEWTTSGPCQLPMRDPCRCRTCKDRRAKAAIAKAELNA